MYALETILEKLRAHKPELQRKYPISRLGVFGSYARGEANIQIIGEAINQLPDDIKSDNPQIPWTLIKGMRNRLIHEYFGTDLPVVWNVIKNDLPSLCIDLVAIQSKLQKLQRPSPPSNL